MKLYNIKHITIATMVAFALCLALTSTSNNAVATENTQEVSQITTIAPVPIKTVELNKVPKIKTGTKVKTAKEKLNKAGFKVKVVTVRNWKYRDNFDRVIKVKQSGKMYKEGTVIQITVAKKPKKPDHVDNGKYGVEKWRPLVRWHLYNRDCYSKRIEDKMLKYCIRPESGGRAVTGGGMGSSDGLCQYISSWKVLSTKHLCKDKRSNYRSCGDWSIWRMVRGYDLKGESFLSTQWVNYPG